MICVLPSDLFLFGDGPMSDDVKLVALTAIGTILGMVVIHLVSRHVEIVKSAHNGGGHK